MKINNKLKAIELKILIIPLTIIVLMFFVIGNQMVNGIKNHYYDLLEKQSLNLARNYSNSLTMVTQAQEIVNKILEDRLLIAGKSITLYKEEFSSELLNEIADNLEVDEVYYYNNKGEILYSSSGKYLGWKAYDGHPVKNFMDSNAITLVEDIRRDSESDIYYKYGYFKSSNGNFIQIGILADKIQDFIDEIDIQKFLDSIKEANMADQICFIDNNFYVIDSTDRKLIGIEILNKEAREAIISNKEQSLIGNINGKKVYEVYVPVFIHNNRVGTLHVGQPLENTENLIKQGIVIGIITLFIVFCFLIYSMVSTYNKNKRLIKLAYFDLLTDLPNKEYLMEYITDIIQKSKGKKKAILLINCSNFRTVNLISGYHYGDKVLKEMGKKLKKISKFYKILFRFNADRFIIFIDNYHDKNDLVSLSNRISEIFKEPIVESSYLDIQIGILEIDNKYHEADEILKDVSIALNYIKSNGINYSFFNEEMERVLEREDLIERELRYILSREDMKSMYLEYQPQFDLRANRIVGFEALARMKINSLGSISPEEFVDIAEKRHLIVPLSHLILKAACDFLCKLTNEGYSDLKVAVNISGILLLRDDIIETVMNIIKETGIKAENLELEITESILMENYKLINEKLKKLRDFKIKIALDDFGTGYSSFSRLKELNIDYVKIDKYFIDNILSKENKELITGDIISMSHKIGIKVVAEGVEHYEQRQYLIENHCDFFQGYLFSRPLSQEGALEILKNKGS